jgi:hypothetical protein
MQPGLKTGLWLALIVVLGPLGLLGCAQQQLGGDPQQPHDGGGPGVDAGCGPLGKMVCTAPTNNCGATTTVQPVCLNGTWTCPPDVGASQSCEPPVCLFPLPSGCTCDPASGVSTCRDAGVLCPDNAPDGSVLYCVGNCSNDTALVSTCDGGVWSCPPGTVDIRTCGSSSRYCSLPPPPGCMCNSTNGSLTCQHDGGTATAPGGHGG